MNKTIPLLFLAAVALATPSRMAAAGPTAFGTNLGIDAVNSTHVTNDFGPSGIGFKTIRIGARCNLIKTVENSAPNWSAIDAQVRAIQDAGVGASILVQVNMGGGAAWPWTKDSLGRPDPVKFGAFFTQVVAHFKATFPGVLYFEAFNEPDLEITWGTHIQKADHYYLMLQEAWNQSAAVRAGTNIKVVGGAVSVPPVSLASTDVNFFNQLWNVREAWGYMDIYSFHIYFRTGGVTGTYSAPELAYGNPSRGLLWSDILMPAANNIDWHGRPVWITECGYDSSATAQGMGASQAEREATQGRREVRAAIICRSSGLIARFLHFSAYWDSDPEAYGFRHGLNGTVKPQWWALKTMCDVLNSDVTVMEMKGYYQHTPSNANYCLFRYNTTSAKVYGWAMWWVPAGGSGPVTMGGGNIPTNAAIYKRVTSYTGATTWQVIPNPLTGSLTIADVTTDPLYIKVVVP